MRFLTVALLCAAVSADKRRLHNPTPNEGVCSDEQTAVFLSKISDHATFPIKYPFGTLQLPCKAVLTGLLESVRGLFNAGGSAEGNPNGVEIIPWSALQDLIQCPCFMPEDPAVPYPFDYDYITTPGTTDCQAYAGSFHSAGWDVLNCGYDKSTKPSECVNKPIVLPILGPGLPPVPMNITVCERNVYNLTKWQRMKAPPYKTIEPARRLADFADMTPPPVRETIEAPDCECAEDWEALADANTGGPGTGPTVKINACPGRIYHGCPKDPCVPEYAFINIASLAETRTSSGDITLKTNAGTVAVNDKPWCVHKPPPSGVCKGDMYGPLGFDVSLCTPGPIEQTLPACNCVNYLNGLKTIDTPSPVATACVKNEENGLFGKELRCIEPEHPYQPMLEGGCPESDMHRCVLSSTPKPVFPICHCDQYEDNEYGHATPDDKDGLCQLTKKRNGLDLCYKRNVNGPQFIGNAKYYGCPSDMFRCRSTAELTIVERAAITPELSILVALVTRAGLLDELNSGPLTVFAPTNAAFEALPPSALTFLASGTEFAKVALKAILLYHVVAGEELEAKQFVDGAKFKTVEGQNVRGTERGGFNEVNFAKIVIPDIHCTNGNVQVIDVVLNPQTIADIVAVDRRELSALNTALNITGLNTVLGDPNGAFTLFAPTNAAFAATQQLGWYLALQNTTALREVLLYHTLSPKVLDSSMITNNAKYETLDQKQLITATVSSMGIKINNATVETGDIPASNGVVHVIDAVLVPPNFVNPLNSFPTIAEVAVGSPSSLFGTLLSLVIRAGLAPALSGPGSFTVFAPTNAAFSKLPAATLHFLNSTDGAEALLSILKYHVLPNAFPSLVFTDGARFTTLNGAKVRGSQSGHPGKYEVNFVTMSPDNLFCSNGIIQVIDEVLLPETIADIVTVDDDLSTLQLAAAIADLLGPLGNNANNLTLFAPTNDAFSKLPRQLLLALTLNESNKNELTKVLAYHAIAQIEGASMITNGEEFATLDEGLVITATNNLSGIFINNAKVTNPNIPATNGIVHKIDTVLIPPNFVNPLTQSIVELAAGNPAVSILVALVTQLNLVSAIQNLCTVSTPCTVLAPPNEAFEALAKQQQLSLSDFVSGITAGVTPGQVNLLTNILLYHVIPDTVVYEREFFGGRKFTTLANSRTAQVTGSLNTTSGRNQVNSADIVIPNIFATNGVIQVIDKVLIPP